MTNKKNDYLLEWAKITATVVEDISAGILGFIPEGCNRLYDVCKSIPLLKKVLAHPVCEKTIKWISGITLTKNLAGDISRCLFWPLGFGVGLVLGVCAKTQPAPRYNNAISRWFNTFSCATVTGGLIGIAGLWCLITQFSVIFSLVWSVRNVFFAVGMGATIGIIIKSACLIMLRLFNKATQEAIRHNSMEAKALSAELKQIARKRTKGRILHQAQDIIVQMNGPQAQDHLENFFAQEYENIAVSIYEKIERHFNYLTDRACCGDTAALERMQVLMSEKEGGVALDTLIERLFNTRTLAKLKDDMDTYYDRWFYKSLAALD